MTVPGNPPSAERLRALRKMKTIAGGLLILAAVVYVVCRTAGDGDGFWGYLQATAEASMVGGLADWFAVTALFRHPLRIPIPHTAIIPRKKDQIGASLGEFVQRYLITGDVVSERIAAARVAAVHDLTSPTRGDVPTPDGAAISTDQQVSVGDGPSPPPLM